jgi:DNA-binding winged helix-turn-helix (wHTH) protein/tetratricopeptide (TPR) repeat protein
MISLNKRLLKLKDNISHVNNLYCSAGYTIHPRSCKVVAEDGVERTVRTKTFQLLMLLIEAEGKTLSKQHILQTIWNDVVVDEQVIFQSIKELRKIFASSEVIKNYPRQGYAWVPIVEILNKTNIHPSKPIESTGSTRFLSRNKIILATVVAMLIMVVAFFTFFNTPEVVSGSIVVLPVQTDIADSDHNWVRYGGMDQLIQRLSSSDHHGVLQTDYVLEVMARAKIAKGKISQQQIGQIFQVSGATLVVELNLTGSVQDYQLIYSLHEKNQVVRGAVLDSSIRGAIDQVAGIVAARLGQDTLAHEDQYRSAFANEMLANALESIQNEQSDIAVSLLEAAISTEPNNIVAKRILIKILLELQQNNKAQLLLDEAIKQATQSANTKELVRLFFWQGASYAQLGELEQALTNFSLAEQSAETIKDWLFLAYIAELRGRIYQFRQEYSQAEEQFSEALKFHKVLQCPLGHSNVLLQQSELSLAQGDIQRARLFANQSLALIEQRQLDGLKAHAQEWLQSLDERQE